MSDSYMGLQLTGLFISAEVRDDNKYSVLIAAGTTVYRVKCDTLPDGLCIGLEVGMRVRASVFNDKLYWRCDAWLL